MKRNLARSVRLFRAFLVEQTDPAHFYGTLARDSADLIAEHRDLSEARVIDVGAGPAEFAAEFRSRGSRYLPVDRDPSAESLRQGGMCADAVHLPVADDSVDVAFSSNLIEHVDDPDAVANELLRITRPGGVVFLSYTNWLSPWGGHETSPWHWFGGRRAIKRYTRRHGHPPKNRVGENLFAVSVAWGLGWVREVEPSVEVLAVRPRYLPDWCAPLLKVPLVREFLTWNLLVILRKR